MGIGLTYIDDHSAYPGSYVPIPELEELLNDKNRYMVQPAINIDEFDNFFKVQVSLPGIHKEDIVILVDDNILTVKVVHKNDANSASQPRIHEFDINYFERRIALPEDADTEFATAEYREGILNLLIPKVTEQSKIHLNRIVVY